MADTLYAQGKISAMTVGIRTDIKRVDLYSTEALAVSSITISTPASDFSVNSSTGQLSNAVALDFEIGSEDVGKVASYALVFGGTGTTQMFRLDLNASVTLSTAGTASFQIGAFTADL